MFGKVRTLAALAVGVALLGATAVSVGAQSAPTPQATPPAWGQAANGTCPCGLNNGAGYGVRGGMMGGGFGMYGTYGNADLTGLLGMTAEEIAAERQAGKSLVEIAAAKNVGEDALIDALMTGRKAQLDELVAAERLTPEQADAMLANMEANVKAMVERTTIGPRWSDGQSAGPGMGYGRGGRMAPGWQNQDDGSTTAPQRLGPGMGRFGLNRG